MGKNMKRLLSFAIKYEGWHTWGKDRATCDAVRRLEAQGYIETDDYRHFRLRASKGVLAYIALC